jgi:hypothetical protein
LALAYEAGVAAGAQQGMPIVGPQYTMGTTNGVESSDPLYNVGPPARLEFDVDAFLSFGNDAGLNAVWTGAAGWWQMVAVNPSAADASGTRVLFTKNGSGNQLGVFAGWLTGKLRLETYYTLTNAQSTFYNGTNAIVGGGASRHIIVVQYDPAKSRLLRCEFYINGVVEPVLSATTIGADGSIQAGSAQSRLGIETGFGVRGPDRMSAVYFGSGNLTAQQVSDYTTEVRARLGGY